ncbi:MAG: hypothetical protein Q8N33_02180 [Rhodocyclaceae bacterium]|nr:hypothetical protein [Rhodocyclaceae bacterium]
MRSIAATRRSRAARLAGNARKELEAKSGKPVVSRANYLALDDATDAATKKLPAKSSQRK